MDRRSFLKSSSLASTAAFVPSFLKQFAPMDLRGERILVVLQLSGGNDGLNTFIPYGDDLYYQNRPGLGVTQSDVLALTDMQGLHPSMTALHSLYDEGLLSIVNSVGYPNPDRSHFRSMDIWQSGKVDERVTTGWLGRYLDNTCTECSPHAAIEVGQSLSIAVQGSRQKALVMESPERLTRSVSSRYHAFLADQSIPKVTSDVEYMYKTIADTRSSAAYLSGKMNKTRASGNYPANTLGNDMKTVANLILSGCDSKVYYLSLSGFDTHVNQKGAHNRLLKQVSDSLGIFVKDLLANNMMQDVSILCFSEFGRRVKQNASGGTDHGAGNNLFVISDHLANPGFYNSTPNLQDLDEGDVRFQIDFRSVYAELLERWMGINSASILGTGHPLLGLLA